MGQKIRYFEALRGLAILMVPLVHTYFYTSFNLFVREIVNCAVPIFFALSSFFLYKKSLDTKEQIISFWRKQISKVYIPVLIWSLPWFIPDMMHGRIIYAPLRLLSCGYSVYYFVAVVIQFYLLLPLLQRYKICNKRGEVLSYVISFIFVVLITYVYVIKGINLRLIIRYGFCLYWLCFFVIGCRLSLSDRKYGLMMPAIVSVIGILASYFESSYFVENYDGKGAGYKLTSFIFSAGICYLLLSDRIEKLYDHMNGKVAKVLEYLGKNSFVLYMVHIHVVNCTHRIVDLTHSWTIYFIVVLVLSIVLIEIIKRLVPSSFHYYIGIY